MADEKTQGDALRHYLTGASSPGGTQAVPALSLGGYRASTQEMPLGIKIADAIPGIIIEYAAGMNDEGAGTLEASTDDSLTWTPPGGSPGVAVTIAEGETKVISGADSDKWIRLRRTSSTALAGTATVTLSEKFNNVVGFDNVGSDDALAGEQYLRALCALNVGATAAIHNVLAYIAQLATAQTSDGTQLGASGAGTVETTGAFTGWPDSGFARIEESDGTLREIVYYSSRTTTALTVPAEGRALLETTAAAGAADDLVRSVPGIEIALEWGVIGAAAQTGSGLDDATIAGDYRGSTDITVRVEIDAEGATDTFRWSLDGGSTWENEGVAITGSAQTLDHGITIEFGATTGHTLGDYWDSACTATATEPEDENDTAAVAALNWSTPVNAAGALDAGTLAAGEQVFLWIRRTIIEGHQSSPDVRHLIDWMIDV